MNLEERFWSKVNILGKDDCWNWMAGLDSQGYGAFKYNGKKYDSHRMAWFLTYDEFPELLVLHSCDNRLCCNPKHMFLGTYQDNVNDMVMKGRQAKGDEISSILKSSDISEIKKYLDNGLSIRKIAGIFNVGKSTIWYIKVNKTWKHIA